MATYLDQFIDSCKFHKELRPDIEHQDFRGMKRKILSYQADDLAEIYKKLRQILEALGKQYVDGGGGIEKAALNAHAYSQGLMETWNHSDFGQRFPLCATLGNVVFTGQSLFPLNRDGIRSMLQRGRELTADIQGHAWLTLDDMTVVDLTVLSTLARWKKYPEPATKRSPVLIWREGQRSDFLYEPLLADNGFVQCIDISGKSYDFGGSQESTTLN